MSGGESSCGWGRSSSGKVLGKIIFEEYRAVKVLGVVDEWGVGSIGHREKIFFELEVIWSLEGCLFTGFLSASRVWG